MASSGDLAHELGLHRVTEPRDRAAGVLPQAAWRLDPSPKLAADEVRVRVDRLNLDAACYRQLSEANDGDGDAIRDAVRQIIATRGKMQNAVTGSGGILTGVVDEVGLRSPLRLRAGDRVATLVSLTMTPLGIYDNLAGWDGLSGQIPCDGHAILFARSIAAVLPPDLPVPLALSILDVCGAPALTSRVTIAATAHGQRKPIVVIVGGSGKSGSLAAAAARGSGASVIIAVVPTKEEAALLWQASRLNLGTASALPQDTTPLVDTVVVADARNPLLLAEAVAKAGGLADVTVVCVDVPGCEGGAILATRQGGTIVFFSMATSFSAAALGAEGVAADVTMLIGNGYAYAHADYALELYRSNPAVRRLFDHRVGQPSNR